MSTPTSTGYLYVISAPSGAGKTSLVQRLLAELPQVSVSVSHTTRSPRPGEVDGKDYHFVDHAQFEQRIAAGEFLEYAQVFDHYYGTSRTTVSAHLDRGDDVILEIDWQGARQVRSQFSGVQGVFILPPSLAALDQRLRSRGQDTPEVIEQRMRQALAEMSHYDEFDYLIINDDFNTSLAALRSVFIANRQRLAAQRHRYSDLLVQLLS